MSENDEVLEAQVLDGALDIVVNGKVVSHLEEPDDFSMSPLEDAVSFLVLSMIIEGTMEEFEEEYGIKPEELVAEKEQELECEVRSEEGSETVPISELVP